MIVVGLNLRAVQWRRPDRQRVAFLDDACAALGQLRPQRDDALTFLDAQPAKIGKKNLVIPRCHDANQSHYAVAKIVFA